MNENNILNLYQRMHAVMEDVSYVQKDQDKIDGKYTAVKHDAVVAVLRPALLKHGVLAIASVDSHEITATWDKTKDGYTTRWTLTEATVTTRFVNVDDPTDCTEIKSFGYGIDNNDKGPGKAISYACKYGLLKPFLFETGDDPDNHQGEDSARPPAGDRVPPPEHRESAPSSAPAGSSGQRRGNPARPATDKQCKMIYAKAKAKGISDRDLNAMSARVTGKSSSRDYTMGDIDLMVTAIEDWTPPDADPNESSMRLF